MEPGGAGYTGPPLIELNGASAGPNGLTITAGNSTVQGLVINRASSRGIVLQTNGGNTIQGCYLGTNSSGTSAQANGQFGIYIDSAPNNTIGGTNAAARNLISGNGSYGLYIIGGTATGNTIQGNYIGTDVNGAAALSNNNGVYIESANNTIGGAGAGARNVISGNVSSEILLKESGANGNIIQGNYIGTNASGTAAVGGGDGVLIVRGSNNIIGGTSAAARNIISGNTTGGSGVHINGGSGVASNNLVQGNYIGTDVNGTAVVPNFAQGISIEDASSNTIGGTGAGAGNVISGNNYGVAIIGGSTSTGNLIQGNLIGTTASGTAALGNALDGIVIVSPTGSNTVGGTSVGARNVISSSGASGIRIGSGAGQTVLGKDR